MRSRCPDRYVPGGFLELGRQFIIRATEAPSGESSQTESENPPDTLTDHRVEVADERPQTSSLPVIPRLAVCACDDVAAGGEEDHGCLDAVSGGSVDRRRGSAEAYSHEIISFGFWAGDRNTPFPLLLVHRCRADGTDRAAPSTPQRELDSADERLSRRPPIRGRQKRGRIREGHSSSSCRAPSKRVLPWPAGTWPTRRRRGAPSPPTDLLDEARLPRRALAARPARRRRPHRHRRLPVRLPRPARRRARDAGRRRAARSTAAAGPRVITMRSTSRAST
jgi:hypothetical protein